jgi:glycosyltransferase involved in cell wall biosynthesis
MHICFISPHLRPSGGPKVILTLANLLQKKGHRVTVAVKRLKDNQLAWLFPKAPNFELIQIRKVSKFCLPETADVIINFMDGDAFGPMPDVPHVLFIQGFGHSMYEREILNLIYPFNAVIATSHWLVDIAVKGGHTKIYLVPPGIDDKFKPLNYPKGIGPKTIGSLYHIAPDKNMDLFIASMNKLRQTIKNVTGLFLAARNSNFEKIQDMRFDHSFIVTPPPQTVPLIYNSLDCWVSPSINEGFGLTPLEAMACGVPTIVVPSGGLDDYLKDRVNCMLVNNDKTEVVNAILELFDNDKLRKRIVANGVQLAKQFSWQKSVDYFEKALFEICK